MIFVWVILLTYSETTLMMLMAINSLMRWRQEVLFLTTDSDLEYN